MEQMQPNLLLERDSADTPGLRELIMNRPAARNALNLALLEALGGALERAARDGGVRVLILTGAGAAFCAGHDLKELRAAAPATAQNLFERCAQLMQALVASPVPVIAAVNGVATAAGCQLVASCDLAIAADHASFVTPGVDIGLFCSTPAVALSRAVPVKAALRMLLTGEALDAATAHRLGLVNDVVAADELDAAVRRLGAVICGKSRATVALGKRAFAAQRGRDLASAYEVATAAMLENLRMEDAAEGIDAFLTRREPRWRDR